ncbi:MAG: glutamine-hydrolyzing GMP synthase [Christensenellales bacterium]
MQSEKIVVLDCGGQYNQLIARRVRETGVYSAILPCQTPVSEYADDALKGIIITGGPQSVYAENSLKVPSEVFELGVPVLGICYGMQLMAHMLGGEVVPASVSEYGSTHMMHSGGALFEDVPSPLEVWMNHTDRTKKLPEDFKTTAHTMHCEHAAMANVQKKFFAVQFHPEVNHTSHGREIIENFTRKICRCADVWSAASLADEMIREIREQVGDNGRVVAGLSGGVDSSVAAVLVHKAIGERLTCIFVDHGLLRQNEAEEVMSQFAGRMGLNIIMVDAADRFLGKLEGVVDPEEKRKIIGSEFIRVFEEESRKIGAEYLMQGTIYPDIIESGFGNAAVIKSHHNVGGLPDDVKFKGLVEPLRLLFKDEVRVLGESLGIPSELVWRQPFPGPGLGIRVVGEITPDRLRIVRESDAIVREEIQKAGLGRDVWQYFTVFTGVRSVGVMGDSRTYDHCIAIRAVLSTDAMTVEVAELPYDLLRRMSGRIINEVRGVNRVVYDITSKPPGTIEWE